MKKRFIPVLILCLISLCSTALFGCSDNSTIKYTLDNNETKRHYSFGTTENTASISETANEIVETEPFSLEDLPEYSGEPYVAINNMDASFSEEEKSTPYGTEIYGELDVLERCTTAFAVVGEETLPTEDRGNIGSVKPTGWHSVKYDFIDGKYLYNRCHLIGYQLTAENANKENLITGTRYLNIKGMLQFENAVADYVDKTNNHVLYKVTPIFEGNNLVASGVHMMAESIEDNGEGINFNVYCYNVQPNIVIDYTTGESSIDSEELPYDYIKD